MDGLPALDCHDSSRSGWHAGCSEEAAVRKLGWLLASYAVAGALLAMASLAVGGPLMTRAERLAGSATFGSGLG